MARGRLAKISMSVLRIYAPLGAAPIRCQWALIGDGAPLAGEGPLAELPRGARRVQLVLPAAQVFITRAKLPQGAVVLPGLDTELDEVSWALIGGDEDDPSAPSHPQFAMHGLLELFGLGVVFPDNAIHKTGCARLSSPSTR